MAKIYVSEYASLGGRGQIAMEPPITEYILSLSSVAAVTTQAIDSATSILRIHTDAICSMVLVATTTGAAAITNKRMPADSTEYFGGKLGYHVSAISNS